jgi:hypothetical protein
MQAIIKVHCYEDFEKNFVESWKSKKNYSFAMGSVGFWYYNIELSGKDLFYYKINSNKLGSAELIAKHNTKNFNEDDFKTTLYDVHLECLCSMIYIERMNSLDNNGGI